jgi:acetyl-CoA carboxylase biotin carboxyl carrier protein
MEKWITMAKSDLPAELLVLLQEFSESGLRELQIRNGDFELYLSNDTATSGPVLGATIAPAQGAPTLAGASPSPSLTPTAELVKPKVPAVIAAVADIPPDAIILLAPNLGTFYRSPKPGAPTYVEIGSMVTAGDELCLIEVMKLFTSVRATEAGRIHAVLVEDGAMIEADQPLFAIVRA